MSESPALNALRAAGYCPEHIGTAQGEDCPECEIEGLRLLLNEYRERITKLREGILAAKHEGDAQSVEVTSGLKQGLGDERM